jgi:hypothetical protein
MASKKVKIFQTTRNPWPLGPKILEKFREVELDVSYNLGEKKTGVKYQEKKFYFMSDFFFQFFPNFPKKTLENGKTTNLKMCGI